MQHGIKHAFGFELDAAAGQLPHALDEGVALVLALGQDRQDQRHRRGRNEFFESMAALCIMPLGMSTGKVKNLFGN